MSQPLSQLDTANVVVIGGGVVGLAIAAEISRRFDDVFLLEALPRFGLGASTRNSSVIHAGIYYPTGSLKARHCLEGSRLLYDFCAQNKVSHRRIGKLIVASDSEYPALEALLRRGLENGVEGLEIVGHDVIARLEPEVVSPVAIYSPNTGVVDTEGLIAALARVATSNGAHLLPATRLMDAEVESNRAILKTDREEFAARVVVNAAGLFSDEVARMFGENRYHIYPCRGEYAEVAPSRRDLVSRLIYPLPFASGHGLGVHFTRTTEGRLLLGPTARYVTRKDDYEGNPEQLSSFWESARQIVPSLRLEDLRPGYAGIRARLLPEQEHRFADFVIERDARAPFVIHTIGIESPGLTASLSIAASVSAMAGEVLS
jgi:L-2-hydroxyglutarate oxidase LhgO